MAYNGGYITNKYGQINNLTTLSNNVPKIKSSRENHSSNSWHVSRQTN